MIWIDKSAQATAGMWAGIGKGAGQMAGAYGMQQAGKNQNATAERAMARQFDQQGVDEFDLDTDPMSKQLQNYLLNRTSQS